MQTDVIIVVSTSRLAAVSCEVLEIGKHLGIARRVTLLHPVHHLYSIRSAEGGVLARKLAASAKARVASDVYVGPEACQPDENF